MYNLHVPNFVLFEDVLILDRIGARILRGGELLSPNFKGYVQKRSILLWVKSEIIKHWLSNCRVYTIVRLETPSICEA